MIINLGRKAQLTLPKEVVKKLKLKEGEALDIKIVDGCIQIIPVAVYPKEYIEKIKSELLSIKKNAASAEEPAVVNIDEILAKLNNK